MPPRNPDDRRLAPRRIRGFTIIEMLICLAIIALLVSLLLPVLAEAHRTAQRTQCQNNLKQINLALAIYHDQFETFPPGYVARGVEPTDDAAKETGPGFAWGCLLLDYLEQTALVSGIDFNGDATDPTNLGVAGTALYPWICPATQVDPVFEVQLDWGPFLLGSASYVGMYGFGSLTEQPGAPPGPGILYRNSYVPLWKIRDGSSQTIIIGERAGWSIPNDGDESVPIDSTWYAAVPGVFRPAGLPEHPDYLEGPASLVLATVGQNVPFPLEARPNHASYIGALSSNHVGGINVGLADTSVRFVSDQIDFATLRRLAQHSDGHPTGEF